MGELISNEEIAITFSDSMLQAAFTVSDISITINSDILVKFSWVASYSNPTTLIIKLQVGTALQGDETLIIKFINDKKFRTPTGGCVQPSTFKTAMSSSLSSVAASAQAASGYTQYFIMGGVMLIFATLIL
jgi:hypothetical protein